MPSGVYERTKPRSDKKTRVNPGLDFDTHDKLVQLSVACGISKTHLAEQILKAALNNPSLITAIQDHYKAGRYRVIPATVQGKVQYIVPRD